MERNRPWILQHLVELLSPRSMEGLGPDGRPVVEYVRDVYAELMAMGEGMRRAGDRDDISSDDEDELENARRAWPRIPLVGTSLAIAKYVRYQAQLCFITPAHVIMFGAHVDYG